MPDYQFQIAGLGTVTASADTEACARLQVGESLGLDPDRLQIVEGHGNPVFEGVPYEMGALSIGQGRNFCENDSGWCECAICEPDTIRLRPLHALLGAVGLGVALLAVLRRG